MILHTILHHSIDFYQCYDLEGGGGDGVGDGRSTIEAPQWDSAVVMTCTIITAA